MADVGKDATKKFHSGKLPDEFIKRVLEATDIVDVVSRHVDLIKKGNNHHGCCPFHHEKTASFTVAEDKQFFHCFGCGAHGDAIKFLQDHLGMNFVEVIKELAENSGIALPVDADKSNEQDRVNPVLYRIMESAASYYQEELVFSPTAIAYLQQRGIRPLTALHFGIGYAPDGWQNLKSRFAGYEGQEMALCGLTAKGAGDRTYDRFRNRLMIPILSTRGDVIGFGGRTMLKEEPKYMNSPDTVLFDKGSELYGVLQASKSIRTLGWVLVVEGYMDVITVSQAGLHNVIGTMGTATTKTHAKRLLRAADKVVFCFDGDKAGLSAAWRAMEGCLPFLTDSKNVRFAFLPTDEDPDSFIVKNGLTEFLRFCDKSRMLSEYLVSSLCANNDLNTAEGRAKLVYDAKPFLSKIKIKKAPLFRLQILKKLSYLTQFTTEELGTICEGDTSD